MKGPGTAVETLERPLQVYGEGPASGAVSIPVRELAGGRNREKGAFEID